MVSFPSAKPDARGSCCSLPHVHTERWRDKDFTYSRTTSDGTEAIIKQMVPFSPRRMEFTRFSESREKKTLKKGKGSLGRLLDTTGAATDSYIRSRSSMDVMKGSKPRVRGSLAPSLVSKIVRVGKSSPHDAALDGAVSRTDRLSVRDGSFHPGDLRVPNRRVNFLELR